MAPTAVMIGPFGGNGGEYRDITQQPPAKLCSITVYYDRSTTSVVNALEFGYKITETETNVIPVGPWGSTSMEMESHRIDLLADEHVCEVFGSDDGNHITSLSFKTDRPNTYGPYGRPGTSTTFRIPVMHSKIVAFFGRADTHLVALGTYAVPSVV